MPNSSQDKGKRFERKAVKFFIDEYPHLIDVKNPARLLGEGRREDGGDLNVFADTTIQVKAWGNLGSAIHAAARSAVDQADYADKPFAVGMVPVPRAKPGTLGWVFCRLAGSAPQTLSEPVVTWSRVSDLIAWLRDDDGPKGYRAYDRGSRIAVLKHGSAPEVEVMAAEAWTQALAAARTSDHEALRSAAA